VNTSAEYYEEIANKLYTAVLADIMDDLGYRDQVMCYEIRPMYDGAQVVGRAATMLATTVAEIPAKPYHLELELLDDLRPGEVVVCTTHGPRRCSIWGELLSTHVRAKGGRGAILDGLTRDLSAIAAMKFPVFAVGTGAADSKGRADVIAIRVPVEAGEVLVHNGDLMVADLDGCVAIPQAIEEEVIRRALQKVAGENRVREILARGASIRQVFQEYGIL
jgi:4-hydroxy-4-methyl-2-oxoglutarate aldolase